MREDEYCELDRADDARHEYLAHEVRLAREALPEGHRLVKCLLDDLASSGELTADTVRYHLEDDMS